MSWRHVIKGFIVCEKCGKPDDKRGAQQKFCRECSPGHQKQRKLQWQRTHPREPATERQKRCADRAAFIQKFGEEQSVKLSKGFALLPDRSGSARAFQFQFPFVGHISKNAIVNIGMMTGKPFIFVREDVNKLKEAISIITSAKVGSVLWPVSKTWIDVVVQKPNNRCDAINVVDTLCDGIKNGLGVDDKWFAIGRLDWELVFSNPSVFVQVSTDAIRAQKSCSTCGQIKYLDEGFRPHYTTKDRHAGVCIECTTALSRSKNKKMNGTIPAVLP